MDDDQNSLSQNAKYYTVTEKWTYNLLIYSTEFINIQHQRRNWKSFDCSSKSLNDFQGLCIVTNWYYD